MAKRIITEEERYRNKVSKLYEKAKEKVWNYKLEDFYINNKFNFTHKTWKGTYCKGGKTREETIEMIKEYIKSSKAPYGKRSLDWLHLA